MGIVRREEDREQRTGRNVKGSKIYILPAGKEDLHRIYDLPKEQTPTLSASVGRRAVSLIHDMVFDPRVKLDLLKGVAARMKNGFGGFENTA
jgi:hypothetical protein